MIIGMGWPASAQFGVSVDPVQSGHAVIQIGHEVEMIGQGTQVVGNTFKVAQQTLNLYNTYQYERMALQNRFGWMQLGGVLLQDQTQNHWGENTDWIRAMNGQLPAINTAYQSATISLANPMWIQSAANPAMAQATLVQIEAMDSAIKNVMSQVAQQRANQPQNAAAQNLLSRQITSTDATLNTAKAQQNITNGALMQITRATDDQTKAITAQNQILVVTAMETRNGSTQHLNDVSTFQTLYVPNTGENLQAEEAARPW